MKEPDNANVDIELQAFVDSLPFRVLVIDEDHKIVAANANVLESLGRTAADVIGQPCPQLIHGQISPVHECPLEVAVRTGSSAEQTEFYDEVTGKWYSSAAYLMKERHNGRRLFSHIIRDITEQKESEESLSETRAQLTNALIMAGAGNWEYDVIHDRFTFNDIFYRIFRTTVAEVGGYEMSSRDYAHKFCYPEDIPLVGAAVQEAIETTDPNYTRQLEHRILYADGEVGYMSVRFFIVKDAAGRTVKTIGVNQDITEAKRTEEDLRRLNENLENVVEERTKDAVRANQAKSEFLAAMSHELRTPLNSVIGFSGILLSGAAGELNEEQYQQQAMISASGKHLLALVDDILDLSKIEAGEIKLEVDDFSLEKVVLSSIGLLHVAAEQRGLKVEISIEDSPATLHTDRRAVEQILINLVGNAVKFTESGTVGLKAFINGDGKAHICIRDTGPGIPEDALETIFDPFRQAGRPIVDGQPRGTGLGLAISSRLAERLGGVLTVESAMGKGSEFTLEIPVWLDDTISEDS